MKRTRKTDAGEKVQRCSLKRPYCGSSTAPISSCGSGAQNLIVPFTFLFFIFSYRKTQNLHLKLMEKTQIQTWIKVTMF